MTNKECYCTVANDGVAVCVCKYRPCEQLKHKEQALDEIEKLISEALDPEKTETEQSFDNFYKCLNIINNAKGQQK